VAYCSGVVAIPQVTPRNFFKRKKNDKHTIHFPVALPSGPNGLLLSIVALNLSLCEGHSFNGIGLKIRGG